MNLHKSVNICDVTARRDRREYEKGESEGEDTHQFLSVAGSVILLNCLLSYSNRASLDILQEGQNVVCKRFAMVI